MVVQNVARKRPAESSNPRVSEPDVVVTIPDAGGVPDDQIIPSEAVPDEAENPVTGPEYGPEEEPEMPEARGSGITMQHPLISLIATIVGNHTFFASSVFAFLLVIRIG